MHRQTHVSGDLFEPITLACQCRSTCLMVSTGLTLGSVITTTAKQPRPFFHPAHLGWALEFA